MNDALACEYRPGGRVSTIVVHRGGRYTLAATGDWTLAVALMKAVMA